MSEEDEKQAAQNFALNYLSYRPRSRKEVYERLRRKGYAERIVREVVAYLTERQYLDDRKFAHDWADFLINRKIAGRILLRQELRLKGISEDIIEEVMRDVYTPEDRERELALALLQKRINRGRIKLTQNLSASHNRQEEGANLPMKKKKKLYLSLANLLLRHGFSRSITRDVLLQELGPLDEISII